MVEPDNTLIYNTLVALRGDIAKLDQGQREIKERLTQVETGIVAIRRDLVELFAGLGLAQRQHDRLVERTERIERRLELAEPEAP